MKPRQRPFLSPIDATGDLGSRHTLRSQDTTMTGYAWKYSDGHIIQRTVAVTEELLLQQTGVFDQSQIKRFTIVLVEFTNGRWREIQEENEAKA